MRLPLLASAAFWVACVGAEAAEIHLAVRRGDVAAVAAIEKARPGSVNELDENGQSPLMYAVRAPGIRMVEMLVRLGAHLELADRQGFTALHTAVERDRVDVVRLLLAHGADANTQATGGRPALFSAAQMGFVAVGELLLDHGAKWDLREHNGMNAVHGAANTGRVDFIRMMIMRGAEVDTRGRAGPGILGGATPLHMAALRGYPDVVEFLLTSGANLHERASSGSTALHYAAFALEPKGEYRQLYRPRPDDGHARVITLLIERRADVNATNNYGDTPLHVAAREGRLDVARRLLAHGADTGTRNLNSSTAADEAERSGDAALVELLRSKR